LAVARKRPAPAAGPGGAEATQDHLPGGLTRTQMAERIGEVSKIAQQKRNISPRLSPSRYLA
jgi:hypothetical protein